MGRFGQPLQDVRFTAAMLSVPYEERYGPLAMSPRLVKAETIRVLIDIVKAAARAQPSLMLFEDVHWADPTSVEVLGMLIDQLANIPLLLVLTPGRSSNRLGPNMPTSRRSTSPD